MSLATSFQRPVPKCFQFETPVAIAATTKLCIWMEGVQLWEDLLN